MGSNSTSVVLEEEGHVGSSSEEVKERRPRERRGRDWSDGPASQETSRSAGGHREPGERPGTFSVRASMTANPSDPDLHLWPLELIPIVSFQAMGCVVICPDSPGKRTHPSATSRGDY